MSVFPKKKWSIPLTLICQIGAYLLSATFVYLMFAYLFPFRKPPIQISCLNLLCLIRRNYRDLFIFFLPRSPVVMMRLKK